MAHEGDLQALALGAKSWNEGRGEYLNLLPDLSFADLSGMDLSGYNLQNTNLYGANLTNANLESANLGFAYNFFDWQASSNLSFANFSGVNLKRADLSGAILQETIFGNTNLRETRGLDICTHRGRSIIDNRTHELSGPLPIDFLRGCGLTDWQIEATKLNHSELPQTKILEILSNIEKLRLKKAFHSCFISYSSLDEKFAQKLYNDLQDNGVRCWYAPKNMSIGSMIRPAIDKSIRAHDKLLIILSKSSIGSQNVEQEVETALAKERETGGIVLFPIRIDNDVMAVESGWPSYVRNSRHIGDFTQWIDQSLYEKSLDRLLNDLRE